MTGPDVIFADEPTGELDSTTALTIGGILRDVVGEKKATVIIATHDLTLSAICDQVVRLVDGGLDHSD